MTETIREQIEQDEALKEKHSPGIAPSEMQKAWKNDNLIPRDEHEAALEDAKFDGASVANRVISEICKGRVVKAHEAGRGSMFKEFEALARKGRDKK